MKHFIPTFLFCLFWCGFTHAEFQVPPLTGRVVDAGNVFTPEESTSIEWSIYAFEQATGGQIVVATLPSLDGISIEEAGIKLADAWKIGHEGKDDGAILLFVVPERQMRLEVGRGWEGPVNDARAGDVIRSLVPYFRAEQYANGAIHAVEMVQSFVTGIPMEPSTMEPSAVVPVQPEAKPKSTINIIPNIIWKIICLIFQGILCIIGGLCGLAGLIISIKEGGGNSYHGGGGSFGGSSSGGGGGGFSGGGGSFGGGGASGRW